MQTVLILILGGFFSFRGLKTQFPRESLKAPGLSGATEFASQNRSDHNLGLRQITHLICARLKYDLYDFFRGGVFGPSLQEKEQEAGPKHPLKKSYRS